MIFSHGVSDILAFVSTQFQQSRKGSTGIVRDTNSDFRLLVTSQLIQDMRISVRILGYTENGCYFVF
mgnify:CR=1 FL=1